MRAEFKVILFSFIFLGISIVLQSTVFEYIAINGIKPDISLIVLIFISVRKGSMSGQISGFGCGLMEDFICGPYLGFHSIIKAVIGFFYGLIQGSFFIDPFLLPILLLFIGTIVKSIIYGSIVILFSIPAPDFEIFAGSVGIEIIYNSLLAPFIFAFLKLFKIFKPQKDREII